MRTVIALAVTLTAATAFAEDKPLSEFTVQGIGLNTTRAVFLTKYPKAVQIKSDDDKLGVRAYVVLDADGMSAFTFLDDKLYMMFAHWKQKNIARDTHSSANLSPFSQGRPSPPIYSCSLTIWRPGSGKVG